MNLSTVFDPSAITKSADPIVELDEITVRYRSPLEKISSFKEYAIRWIRRDIRFDDFLALDNVNLKVYSGEVIGIVGPNGAGKSTLLKVISRVLKPTIGRVRIRGQVSPLLELGAGFDSELTGRENVYLNSAILGFSKRDIDSRFDRIVEFAGLREFIDAPVRTYSTGMVARLGFAVATDVQPEILIVDEILGVGDAEFQTRSFERIQGFQAAGSTILLVTHSLDVVREMCSRAIWLDHGELLMDDDPENVVARYLEHSREQEIDRLSNEKKLNEKNRWGSRRVEISNVRLTDAEGAERNTFESGQLFRLEINYIANQSTVASVFGLAIHHNDGTHLTGPNTNQYGLKIPELNGTGTVTYQIPALPLLNGLYRLTVAVVDRDSDEIFDYHGRAYPFRVVEGETLNERFGYVSLGGDWTFEGE